MEQISHLGKSRGPLMVAKMVEVITEELIINKLMVDGDNMIRLEGF